MVLHSGGEGFQTACLYFFSSSFFFSSLFFKIQSKVVIPILQACPDLKNLSSIDCCKLFIDYTPPGICQII